MHPGRDLLKRHYVFAITAPVFWSLAGVVVKSLEQATEWQINFYRCLSLTLFVAAVTLIRYRRSTLAVLRMGGLKTVISGALLSGAMLCNVVALKYTTVAVAVFVMAAAPILAALLGRLFLGEEVRARVWISIVLAIFAVWMLMTYIVPKVIFFHQEKGAVIPAYFQMPVNVCEITTRYWYLWTPILFSAVGWFEWKCTSQNKVHIRTFTLVGLSLISNAFVLWLALTIAIATSIFLHLPPPID